MADRIPTVIETKEGIFYTVVEATISTSDTVTINSIKSIARAIAAQKIGGTEVVVATSGNVVTISTTSLSNVDVVILAFE